ncbi:MAG: hypothetical protein PHQ01_02315 [Candidatus Pacebacteria bacterium]|nr:hypothetical protein [Bacteroidales bacterium]MDD3940385.1 hypothetical protein [Candidatus Paceibacterota bacterium]
MKKNIKLVIGIVIGLILLPTIAFGGTFVSSLIEGKSVDESVKILANQIDLLFGRMDVVENETAKIKQDTEAISQENNSIKEDIVIIQDNSKDLEVKNEQIDIKNQELEIKSIELSEKLIQNQLALEESQKNLLKEEACRKANELKFAPPETKVMGYTETSNMPINSKFAPNTTEDLLIYLKGYMNNYKETGSFYYLHNPDYNPTLAQEYIVILEERMSDYLIQKDMCY